MCTGAHKRERPRNTGQTGSADQARTMVLIVDRSAVEKSYNRQALLLRPRARRARRCRCSAGDEGASFHDVPALR
jgi:hypothetical protein